MTAQDSELEQLQKEWKDMFQKALPAAATFKSPSQSMWPVHVDHCFARIILDAVVGIDTPWMEKIKTPAYKNMSKEQLESSIELGTRILGGHADIIMLNNRSIALRMKGEQASGKVSDELDGRSPGTRKGKRKINDEAEGTLVGMEKEVKKRKSSPWKPELPDESRSGKGPELTPDSKGREDFTPWLKKIALSEMSSFQKKVLTALCQVPRGRYTTYAAISKHLFSSPRAVGNALRNNPFAPQVPCHRVLASGGGLGGFHGSWGRNGKEGLHDDKKRKLLREEGVKFDGRGKVIGSAWEEFS